MPVCLVEQVHGADLACFRDLKKVVAAADDESAEEADEGKKTYDYLLSMPILSLTLERVRQLQSDRDTKKQELDTLEAKTPADRKTSP